METQQTRTLGALLYDNTPPAYVPPPVKEIKELSSAKEDYYIKAKDNRNLIDETLANMPYLPQSKGLYDSLRGKANEVLGSINSENYEDKLLDTKQLASDIKGKFGGTKLVEQAQNLGVALKSLDDAYDKGDIANPEMRDWNKQQTIEQTKGLQQNPDGTFTSTSVSPTPFAKFVDRGKRLNDIITGWKEDGTVSFNKDGSIVVNRDIPGYLATGSSTFTKPEDVYKAAMAYMKDTQDVKAFTEYEAKFNTRNSQGTIQELFSTLNEGDKQQLTGKKNATVEDVYLAMNSQGLNAKDLLQKKEEGRLYGSSADVAANKFGFNKDEMALHEDFIFRESLKASQAKAKELEESNASVSFEPFMTQQILNPIDAVKLESNKNNLIAQRTSLQARTNQYQKALEAQEANNSKLPSDKRKTNYTQDQLIKLQKEQSNLDVNIADTVRQQNQVRKITKDVASKVEINLDKLYDDNYYKSIEDTKDKNKSVLQRLFSLVPFDGDKSNLDNMLNERGEVKPEIIEKLKQKSNTFAVLPTKEEYYDMVTKALVEKDSKLAVTNAGFNLGPNDNKKWVNLSPDVSKGIDKIISAQPDIQYEVGKPITTMLVVGDKLNSNLRAFTNMESANTKSFRKTPEQYSIKDVDGSSLDVKSYVKKLGYTEDEVDWTKVEAKLSIQTDREFGQNYALFLPLTANAQKEHGTDALKLIGINTYKNVPSEQKRIRETLLQTVQDINNNDYGEEVKKQMGSLYFNNTEDGVDFYKKNLYTLSAGSHADFDLTGSNGGKETYRITTTAKDADTSDLLNVNFHLGRIKNNVEEVLAVNNDLPANDPNRTNWVTLKEINDKTNYPNLTRVVFDTPEDIGANIGYTKMQQDLKTSTVDATKNVYAEYMNSSSYSQTSNSIQDGNYSKVTQQTKEYYHGTEAVINLNNFAKGTKDKVIARVTQADLVNYEKSYPNNIKTGKYGAEYPYINKDVFPLLTKIITDFDVLITDGFRGEDTHKSLPESSKNSLHKYGYSVDLSLGNTEQGKKGQQLYNDLQNDNSLLKKYGILKAMKHNVGGTDHLHLEFNPNN